MYNKMVLDHFRNPRNVGVIEDANGLGEVGNPLCGDMMTIYLKQGLSRELKNTILFEIELEGKIIHPRYF